MYLRRSVAKFYSCFNIVVSTSVDNRRLNGGWLIVTLPEMKYNQSTLNRIESILEEAGYVVRYERGTFQSGYCILQQKKVVVLNKFLNLEGRINTLVDLMPQLNIVFDSLTHESQKLFEEIMSKPANE